MDMSQTVTLQVSGMKCMGCVANAEQALEGLPGLEQLDISLEQGVARLSGRMDVEEAIIRLQNAGYPAERGE